MILKVSHHEILAHLPKAGTLEEERGKERQPSVAVMGVISPPVKPHVFNYKAIYRGDMSLHV